MNKIKIVIPVLFLLALSFIIYRSVAKSKKDTFKTSVLQYRDIQENISISGNVFPQKEIEIKPQLSGILEEIFVKIGEQVREGTPIASVKLVPGTFDLERYEANVKTAEIEYNAKKTEYERSKKLYDSHVISSSEMDEYTRLFEIAKENMYSAQNQLDILQKGRIPSKNISNRIQSSTSGTIIDIPVETGTSVIERNNYNPGTTVAIVAEMNKFRFRTSIAEKNLKYLDLGDTINLIFNAYDSLKTQAVISKISSKGNLENGVMKYLIEAEFSVNEDIPPLRSGYSATAEIILQERKHALSIEEKYIVYENDSAYLYVPKGKEVAKKLIKTGISDGIHTEIVSDLDSTTQIITNYNQIEK
ncbi:MAG: efflux RND transporter periplasmic adaptor subunit [Tannerella sp.]|jgi:HlyD family secretion protein|nr:efflux RND transporter periplasmic adaptor subunit [Tannerella sp.]